MTFTDFWVVCKPHNCQGKPGWGANTDLYIWHTYMLKLIKLTAKLKAVVSQRDKELETLGKWWGSWQLVEVHLWHVHGLFNHLLLFACSGIASCPKYHALLRFLWRYKLRVAADSAMGACSLLTETVFQVTCYMWETIQEPVCAPSVKTCIFQLAARALESSIGCLMHLKSKCWYLSTALYETCRKMRIGVDKLVQQILSQESTLLRRPLFRYCSNCVTRARSLSACACPSYWGNKPRGILTKRH